MYSNQAVGLAHTVVFQDRIFKSLSNWVVPRVLKFVFEVHGTPFKPNYTFFLSVYCNFSILVRLSCTQITNYLRITKIFSPNQEIIKVKAVYINGIYPCWQNWTPKKAPDTHTNLNVSLGQISFPFNIFWINLIFEQESNISHTISHTCNNTFNFSWGKQLGMTQSSNSKIINLTPYRCRNFKFSQPSSLM